jgi:hypothetical protein
LLPPEIPCFWNSAWTSSRFAMQQCLFEQKLLIYHDGLCLHTKFTKP